MKCKQKLINEVQKSLNNKAILDSKAIFQFALLFLFDKLHRKKVYNAK